LADQEDLSQELMHTLWQLRKVKPHAFFYSGEMKPSEMRLLLAVHSGPQDTGISVSELGRRLHVTSSTVTQLINEMEESGLIVRKTDRRDRRMVRVFLTEKSNHAIRQVEEAANRFFRGLVNHLGEEETRRFIAYLKKAYHYLDTLSC